MSELTLDEAIKHCLEVAEKQEDNAKDCNSFDEWTETEYYDKESCLQCAADHRQLAEWLTELKQLKAIIAGYGDVNMQKLEMVLAMMRIGSEGAWAKIEREKELKEAKRLLKSAVEDINFYVDCFELHCDECCCDHDNHCHWRHEAEALKLIGGETDEHL